MAATPPTDPTPAGDDRNLVPPDASTVAPLDYRLQQAWAKYRGPILGACALILLGIIGKGIWEHLQKRRELDVQGAYAAAATSEQLRSFASSHPEHRLAGVAHLRLADEAYTAGRFADAVGSYDRASAILGSDPLGARAQLGRAMSRIKSGATAEASKELEALATAADQLKAVRTEAAYHLMSLAVEAKNSAEAQRLSDLLMQIDPTSPWTQRGLSLRATLPAATPEATPAPESAAEPAGVQVTLPKK